MTLLPLARVEDLLQEADHLPRIQSILCAMVSLCREPDIK